MHKKYKGRVEISKAQGRNHGQGRTNRGPKRQNLRRCIPNFKPNIRVGFRVGTSFLQFLKFELNVIFCNFQKVQNRTNSEIFISSEFYFLTQKQVFWPKNRVFWPKNRVFWPKNRKLFPSFFHKIFASSKKAISELRKMNFSETRKNKKFGNFRLMQGLTKIRRAQMKKILYIKLLFIRLLGLIWRPHGIKSLKVSWIYVKESDMSLKKFPLQGKTHILFLIRIT